MDKNKLLTPIVLRLLNDKNVTDKTDLGNIIGLNDNGNLDIPVIKGPRKTTGVDECITVNAPSAPKNPNSKAYNGTILINYHCPNYSSGNARIEKMGPVAARIEELMDDNTLDITGYRNYNFVVDEPMGPLWDSDEPDEHFMSIRINFGLIKK